MQNIHDWTGCGGRGGYAYTNQKIKKFTSHPIQLWRTLGEESSSKSTKCFDEYYYNSAVFSSRLMKKERWYSLCGLKLISMVSEPYLLNTEQL